MAYTEKYYHSYCDSFKTLCRVSILQRDYVGSSVEMEASDPPIVVAYESDDDFKFSPIRATSATVNLVFGTGNMIFMEDMWTADEREFKIEHYVDGSLDWVGYVIPNGFSHELRGGIYYGSLTAADGLKTLQSLPFISQSGKPYGTEDLTYNNGFEFPFSLILTEILRKLDLDLNTWTCVDVYEKNMIKTGDTRNADPLSASFANVKTYINDTQRKDIPYWSDANEAMNCFEVLNNMCVMFGARISQNKGVWTFKRINSDADYGSGATQRYWRKYNTLSVYIGREAINNTELITCSDKEAVLIGDTHQIIMDEVYAAYRMNYKFQLLREGDSPLVLIENGDFANWNNTSKLSAPDKWLRWRDGSKWYPRIKPITITDTDAGGYTTGLEFGTQAAGVGTSETDPVGQVWAALRYATNVSLTKGDSVYFTGYFKFSYSVADNNIYAPFIRVVLTGASGKRYWLKNQNIPASTGTNTFAWDEGDGQTKSKDDIFALLDATYADGDGDFNQLSAYNWKKYSIQIPTIPENGTILFDINGLAKVLGKSSDAYPKIKTFWNNGRNDFAYWFPVREGEYIDAGGSVPRMQVTGLNLGTIPDTNQYAEAQDFIYENSNKNYSLEVDPAEVLNGDVLDKQHVSRIIVPSNTTDLKNFWDTIDNKYGGASLGLITVKSIMNLYYKPFRLLEGDVKTRFGDADTRFSFDAIPGKEFLLLRGTYNQKRNYIQDATFFEITSEDIPAGGSEGGNSIEAKWVLTGNKRCQQVDNLNTGIAEVELRDSNINSETYNQSIWETSAVLGLTYCPIGEPDKYLWGTDDSSLVVSNLTKNGFYIDPDDSKSISVDYSNPGGEYIYFVHLASLGLVESIQTEGQPEIISDFQYMADVTINSYLYRVLRQNHVTANFNNFQVTYIFS
ncbi:structural protein [Cellulophaga phage phi18:2]|uniref:Structural protein n=2 Tax=Cellulophaga phage phi18:1 TaxID=1327982 RepID=S0A318_9CAUD|nr:virion structural protein [Cellulophaga phage phi18:1]AGO48506.1 structural protein [Cellulophaga phage phi18:1]AGO49220.1 structural protein [Cellulophaga phage phi18:2]